MYARIPFHWKLTIWAALLLCVLFVANNAIQYVFVEKWMTKQEEQRLEQDMKGLLNRLLAKETAIKPENDLLIRQYLEKENTRNGMIRILSTDGQPIVVVADNMPQAMVHAPLPDGSGMGLSHRDGMVVKRSPITIFDFQGSVEIVRSMQDTERLISAFYRIMVICCIVAIIMSGLGGMLLSRQLIKPLQSMNETIRKVKQNGLQERMSLEEARDDISALKHMFNDMMDQVERSFLQQKQFVEDASHELRTPIAVLEGHLALLRRWGKTEPEVMEESLQISMEELTRLKTLVEQLLILSRAEKLTDIAAEERCDRPVEITASVAAKLGVAHPAFRIMLETDSLAGIKLAISEHHLEGILRILLDNAIKYSGESKEVRISSTIIGNEAIIAIQDYGIGIDEKDMPYIWDRFYRADKSRNGKSHGYGLGLSIAKSIMDSVHGHIELKNGPQGGTVAAVRIPIIEIELASLRHTMEY